MLELPQAIGLEDAPAVVGRLRADLHALQGSKVVVEARELLHFDSSALAVLLDCRREAARMGKSFVLQGAPAKLLALADLYGVRELLCVAPVPA